MDKQWIAVLIALAVMAALAPLAMRNIRRLKRTKGTAQLFWSLFFGFAFLNNRELMRIEDARDDHQRKPPDPGGDKPTTISIDDSSE